MRRAKEMPYHRGLVVKLYPSDRQKHIIALNDGAKRAVYNFLVATNNELYQLRKVRTFCEPVADRIAYLNSVIKSMSAIQNALPFLYSEDIDAFSVANAVQGYHAAWKNLRDRHTGVPSFKKKSYEQSYKTNGRYDKKATSMNESNLRFLDKNHVQLPKLGRIRFSGSPKDVERVLAHTSQTRISSVKVSRDAVGEYWASFSLASEFPFYDELPGTGAMEGIDLNLLHLVDDSDGGHVENPRFYRRSEKRLAKEQRKLSRMREHAKKDNGKLSHSKNYQEQRKKVAYVHRRVSRQRMDHLHRISKREVENQDFLAAEDLRVRNLKRNHSLAKSISDAGWRTLLSMLAYKADLYGKTFVLVQPRNTAQTCSSCGYVLRGDERLSLSDREWVCPSCGARHDRDHNAAKNILARGLKQAGYA